MVLSGELRPGTRIHIDGLRRQLNIGASPVREALSILSSEQIVERHDQRGFRTPVISVSDFDMLLETRCQVEALALAEAIRHGDARWEERIGQAEQALSAFDRRNDQSSWEAAHREFHLALVAACPSRYLFGFCTQLHDLALRYRNVAMQAAYPGRLVDGEHRALSEAARARDAERACALLEQHYRDTGAFLKRRLSELEAAPKPPQMADDMED